MKIWRAHGMSEGVTGSDGGGGRLINVGALDMASFRLVRILQGRGVRLFYVTRDKVLCDNYPLKLLSKTRNALSGGSFCWLRRVFGVGMLSTFILWAVLRLR